MTAPPPASPPPSVASPPPGVAPLPDGVASLPPGVAPLPDGVAHVLMTRFNMATPGRESDLRNRPGWLARRFELFERHCLPSVAAQTAQDFHWVIYFDENTPQAFRDRIEAARRVRDFTPYYTGLFPASGWPRSLQAVLDAKGLAPGWLLSSRLDNDDGLARDYIARTRAAVTAAVTAAGDPRTGGFNITEGFILSAGRVYRHRHSSNAFFSFLEPFADDMVTASGIQHMALAERGPITQIDGPGAWLQVVHGENVSNRVRGRRVAPDAARDRFAPEAVEPLVPVGAAALALENAVAGAARGALDAVLGLRHAVKRALR